MRVLGQHMVSINRLTCSEVVNRRQGYGGYKYVEASVLCILGAVSSLAIARLLDGFAFSPLGTFGVTWFTSLALYNLNLVGYSCLKTMTSFVLAMAMGSFALGSVTIRLAYRSGVRRRSGHHEVSEPGRREEISKSSARKLLILTTVLAVSCLAGVSLTVRYVSGILHKSMLEVYSTSFGLLGVYNAPAWVGTLTTLGIPVLPFSIVLQRLYPGFKRYFVFLSVVTITALMLNSFRSYLFYSIVWATFVYLLSNRQQAIRHAAVAGAIIAGLLIYFALYAIVTGELFRSPFLTAYHYIAANFPAFNNLLQEGEQNHTFGVLTFRPIFRALSFLLPGMVDLPSDNAPFTQTPFLTNTYTFLREFYVDFGIIGTIVFPWLIGALASLLYIAFSIKGGPGLLLLTGLVSMWIVFSPFANQFVTPKQWAFAALCMVVGYIADSRRLHKWSRV